MTQETGSDTIVAEQYLMRLKAQGVQYIFANGGTDFAPLVLAYARAGKQQETLPIPILVPHEGVAVAMAHGVYLATGKPQAVMVHVNVGTANSLCALINAARDNVPILMTAGRSPLTESGFAASRDGFAQWAQEMFDQAGMLREVVKWDYELRLPQTVVEIVDRAMQVMQDAPVGPVYLSLPREILAAAAPQDTGPPVPAFPSVPGPDPQAVEAAVEILAAAQSPLIITRCHGASAEDAKAIADLAHAHSIPVIEFRMQTNVLATQDPMLLGYDPGPYLAKADAVLVIENDVPWLPAQHGGPDDAAKVIHIGSDPGFQQLPMRGFRRDVAITSKAASALSAIGTALSHKGPWLARHEQRTQKVADLRDQSARKRAEDAIAFQSAVPIDPRWASTCLGEVLPPDAMIFNEYPLVPPYINLTASRQMFGMPAAGGLGWAMGAALGAKLALPDRFVVAAMGDGTYMLNNPMAGHFVSEANDLPILYLIFNNAAWMAVPRSADRVFPDAFSTGGHHDKAFTQLSPSPRFERAMAAFDGYSDVVSDPDDLKDALRRAVQSVLTDKVQALVNIHVS